MINEGCLEGVDEVYGFHNVPSFKESSITVISGTIMSSSTTLKITIFGKEGHASEAHKVSDVISCGASIISNLHSVKQRGLESKENAVFSITKFEAGNSSDNFPSSAVILGTIRTLNMPALHKIIELLKSTA